MQLYWDDADGYNSGTQFYADGTYVHWHCIPAVHTGLSKTMAGYLASGSPLAQKQFGVLRCPLDTTVAPNGQQFINYGMNGVYLSTATGAIGLDKLKITTIKRPTEVMALGDGHSNRHGANAGFRIGLVTPGLHNATEVAKVTRHPGRRAAFAFVDGHVSQLDFAAIVTEVNLYEKSVFFNRFQNY